MNTLFDSDLQNTSSSALEHASPDLFDHHGGLDEPQTTASHRVFARSTEEQSDDTATRPNRVLKEQFDADGKKLRLTNAQRRSLAKRGRRLGWQQLQQYANLVRPETVLLWHRKFIALKYTAKRRIDTTRQRRMNVIRELCVKFATENPEWGYGRIQGALANLGYKISMTTVGNILRAKGIVPAPERGRPSNWKRFIRSHMDVTAVADFFSIEVWTLRGLVRYQAFSSCNWSNAKSKLFTLDASSTGR